MSLLDDIPVATVLTLLGALVGGVVAIVNPDVLSFEDYLKSLGALAAGSGLLGYARAVSGRGLKQGTAAPPKK